VGGLLLTAVGRGEGRRLVVGALVVGIALAAINATGVVADVNFNSNNNRQQMIVGEAMLDRIFCFQ